MLFRWIREKRNKGNFFQSKCKKKQDETGKLKTLPYRSELGGLVPANYDVSRHLEYNLYKIENKIEELLENIELDEYNEASFLDEYIEARFQLVRNDLKRQKIRHKHIINGLQIIKQVQLTNIKNIKERIQETEKRCQEEIDS